jgi:osmotically-inducible protein OsmY
MRADEGIKQAVVEQLVSDNRLNAAEIQVTVSQGEVGLEGTVLSLGARAAATTDAWGVRGVVGVNNELKVRFPRGYSAPTDSELMNAAREALTWSSQLDSTSIHLGVNDGVVDLDGTVDAYWKKCKAENLVAELGGVVDVVNRLAVVPHDSVVDTSIAAGIAGALDRSALVDAEAVTVSVNQGTVTLSGEVPSWTARLAAHEAAANTLGVVEVRNTIRVAGE